MERALGIIGTRHWSEAGAGGCSWVRRALEHGTGWAFDVDVEGFMCVKRWDEARVGLRSSGTEHRVDGVMWKGHPALAEYRSMLGEGRVWSALQVGKRTEACTWDKCWTGASARWSRMAGIRCLWSHVFFHKSRLYVPSSTSHYFARFEGYFGYFTMESNKTPNYNN